MRFSSVSVLGEYIRCIFLCCSGLMGLDEGDASSQGGPAFFSRNKQARSVTFFINDSPVFNKGFIHCADVGYPSFQSVCSESGFRKTNVFPRHLRKKSYLFASETGGTYKRTVHFQMDIPGINIFYSQGLNPPASPRLSLINALPLSFGLWSWSFKLKLRCLIWALWFYVSLHSSSHYKHGRQLQLLWSL